jgi:serine/threonine protein kinase
VGVVLAFRRWREKRPSGWPRELRERARRERERRAGPPAAREKRPYRPVEMQRYLEETVGIRSGEAGVYAAGLAELNWTAPEQLAALSVEDLVNDFGLKKGHARKVKTPSLHRKPASEKHLASMDVTDRLPDGSSVELVSPAERLGSGGSGEVQVALRTRPSGRTDRVACKTLFHGSDKSEQEKFMKEYEMSLHASQTCGGACRIHGIINMEGTLALIMKLYDKGDFAKLLDMCCTDAGQRTPLPLHDAVDYGLQILCALSGLHDADIIVRDLKPNNILVEANGTLVISDFGIARVMGMTVTAATTTAAQGTPHYMSPEGFDPDEFGRVERPADMWAWACIMLEMLTGLPPWPASADGAPATYPKIMTKMLVKQQTPLSAATDQVLKDIPDELTELLSKCFALKQGDRPVPAEVAPVLKGLLRVTGNSAAVVDALDPGRPITLTVRQAGSAAYTSADSLLQNTWIKREVYEFISLVEVHEIDNARLQARYDKYRGSMPADTGNGNEHQVFHGCPASAVELGTADNIVEHGFLAKFQTSSAGEWQRFGPGFYFALQASKSHEYPLPVMSALQYGDHEKTMLLCKVAKGKVHQTKENMDQLQDAPPGFHSVLGIATADGPLNYDELVVYNEAAVLPYALVTYKFRKLDPARARPPPQPAALRLSSIYDSGVDDGIRAYDAQDVAKFEQKATYAMEKYGQNSLEYREVKRQLQVAKTSCENEQLKQQLKTSDLQQSLLGPSSTASKSASPRRKVCKATFCALVVAACVVAVVILSTITPTSSSGGSATCYGFDCASVSNNTLDVTAVVTCASAVCTAVECCTAIKQGNGCELGYTHGADHACSIPLDYCEWKVNPCHNAGECVSDGHSDFNCTCAAGWAGATCQTGVPFCDWNKSPCQHGGSCKSIGRDGYTCTSCVGPWTGTDCDAEIPYCDYFVNPCDNAAICVSDSNTGYSCTCPQENPVTVGSRWSGKNCTEPTPYCDWNTNPCKHDGTCVSDGQTKFRCECSGTEWTGTTCEGCADGLRGTGCDEVIPYCEWHDDPCPDNAECTSDGGDKYTCPCTDGWSRASADKADACDDGIPYCEWHDSPCRHSGTCESTERDSYTCNCATATPADAWTGTNCDDGVDYCDWNSPCQNGGTCASAGHTDYTCRCAEGWTGTNCDEGIPFCHWNDHPCGTNQRCVGSGRLKTADTCPCDDGWTGDDCTTGKPYCDWHPNPCQHGGTCASTGRNSAAGSASVLQIREPVRAQLDTQATTARASRGGCG